MQNNPSVTPHNTRHRSCQQNLDAHLNDSGSQIITFICPSVRTAGWPCVRWTGEAATVTGGPGWMGMVWGAACGWPSACTCGYGLTTMVSCLSSLNAAGPPPPPPAGGWSCWPCSASRLPSVSPPPGWRGAKHKKAKRSRTNSGFRIVT